MKVKSYKSAAYYDLINADKDYESEAALLSELIEQHKRSSGANLLDVCCGTGAHIRFLQAKYACEGLDIDPEFIAIAKKKLPDTTFHLADMSSFRLPKKYDVITCLFSSIAYARSKQVMAATIGNMYDHLAVGGVLIIEPWYTSSTFQSGHYTAIFRESENQKIARMYFWSHDDGLSICQSQMLIVDAQGIQHIAERHELGLFSVEEYQDTIQQAGLEVTYDPFGLIGRGLFVGKRL